MTVELSVEQVKMFENNGISEDDLRYGVEEYRKRGVSDSEIQKKLNTKYEALNGAVVTPELKDKQGNTVTEASTDYATQKGEVKKRGVIHPVDFVKSLGKGFLRGTGSLGIALGKRYGNDIRKAMGKRPLTSYEIDNLYGKKLGLPEQGVAYKTGEVVGDVAPYFLLPETKVAGLGKWGNRLLSFGYQGGVGGLLPSVAENGFNLKQNAKDALIGAGTSIALGGALSKVGDKAKAIAERRSTPLSERMTPEQKQNAYNNRGLQERLDEMKNNPNVINDENFYNGVDSLPEEQQKQFWQAQGKEYVAQKRSQIRQLQSDKKQAVDKINAERQKALQNDVSFYNPAKKVNKEYDKQVLKTQKEYNQKIKKVQDDIDLYGPEDDNLNLNKLKNDIKGERYDKTETTHEYTTNRHKNSYSRHLVEDDETYNIKEAQNELNKIISDIANKPENINDEAFMADIEQRFNGVMGKLEGMPDELKEEMQTKMGNAMKKAQRYNDYKYNPDKKAEIDREYQQQMNPQAKTPTAGNEQENLLKSISLEEWLSKPRVFEDKPRKMSLDEWRSANGYKVPLEDTLDKVRAPKGNTKTNKKYTNKILDENRENYNESLEKYNELDKEGKIPLVRNSVTYNADGSDSDVILAKAKMAWKRANKNNIPPVAEDEMILDTVNPSNSGVFENYNPQSRANATLGKNITTYDKTANINPDEIVEVYRGVPKEAGDTLNAGDFVTTNKQLAKDYAGSGKVISQKVKARDILDDMTEPLGEEYIYRPADEVTPKTTIEGTGTKTSKFIDTVNNSSLANDSIKGKMNATYQTITNKETLAKAQKIIDDDMQGAINRVLLQDKPSEVEIAMGEDLARRLQATGNPEDVKTAIAILEKTASDLTKAGRTVQAARIWQALTPQGALLSYQKAIRANTPPHLQTVLDNLSEITNAVKNAQTAKEAEEILRSSLKDFAPLPKNKIVKELKSAYKNGTLDVDTLKNAVKEEFKIQELTPEKSKQIDQLAKNIQEAKTPRDREVATALLKREIEEVKPVSLGRKISTLHAAQQLLTPITILRNLIGNGLYGATEDITQSILATPIDKTMSLVTGEKTLVPTNIGTQLKGLIRGTKLAWDDIINGIDTSTTNAGKYGLWGGRTFRDGGIGSALETAMNVGLRLPDRAAYTAVYDEAVENMLRASGVKNVTRKMIEEAPEAIKKQANLEALQRTFQDDSRLAKAGQGLKNWLNLGKDFGFGDLILKYPKTPSNILDRGISYSPIGLGKGIYETVAPIVNKSMPFNQRVASMDLARGLMGTGIMGGGIGLTQLLPDTQGAREDKNRLRQNLMAQGNRPYSIPIGDKSYSYDWAVPTSIPFSAGINYNNGSGLVESVLSSMNTLTEQPLLQGLQTLAGGGLQNMPESAINTGVGIVNSFNPSLLRQTAHAIDPYYRETKDGTKGLGGKVKTQFNRLLSNIPVVSEGLPIKYDVTGQPVSRGATLRERVFNSFFNPANVSNRPNNYALNKSMDIFNQTGESKALYPVVPNQVTINGEKKVLTPKQRSEYQKELGQMTQDIRSNMFNDTDFTNMTAEEQAEEMDKYNKAVNNAIKFYMFNAQPSTYKGLTQDVIDGYFDNVGYRNR